VRLWKLNRLKAVVGTLSILHGEKKEFSERFSLKSVERLEGEGRRNKARGISLEK